MKYLPVFACGHPRVPSNWIKWGQQPRPGLRCKTCRQLKKMGLPTPGKVVFSCGHPNAGANRMPNGKSEKGERRYRCAVCTYANMGIIKQLPYLDPKAVEIGTRFIMQSKLTATWG